MATKTYTDAEYAAMEAALAERTRVQAEAAAKLAADLKAVEDAELAEARAWLASDHVKAVQAELTAMLPSLRVIPRVAVYAYDFLGALSNAAGPLPVSAPAPTPTAEGNTDAE